MKNVVKFLNREKYFIGIFVLLSSFGYMLQLNELEQDAYKLEKVYIYINTDSSKVNNIIDIIKDGDTIEIVNDTILLNY